MPTPTTTATPTYTPTSTSIIPTLTQTATPAINTAPTPTTTATPTSTSNIPTPTQTATPSTTPRPRDLGPLIALYNATGGDNWSDNDNWLSDRPLNEWHGITTNIVGRVTEINLRANRLHGHIPPELSLLPRLERLDLSINGLIRDLPGELARLTNLTYLDISSNDLTGQIPYEIGRLRGLNFVDLSLNRLTGEIPHSLASSSTITRINLSYNQLTGGIPTDFAHGSKLQELRLTKNQLTSEIPAEIERLQSLEELYLNDNQLSGEIPPGIGQLSQLDRLDLSNNQLSGVIPTEMSELTRLFILNVDNNQLTGSVPFALAKLERLWMLSIADNNFTGCIPKELRRVSTNNIEYANVIVCGEPPRTETITPPYIEWTISDEVTPSQELAARLGVQWLADYLELIGWPTPNHKTTLYLGGRDFDAMAQAWVERNDGCDIQCAKHYLDRRGWIDAVPGLALVATVGTSGTALDHLARTVAQQTVRAVQFGLLDDRQLPTTHSGPSWMVEGMATLIERLAHSLGRDIPFTETRNEIVGGAQSNYAPLSTLEEGNPHCTSYCGAVAVELLASQVGLRELANFYTQHMAWSWHHTFERIFNITVPEFYARYEQHRINGFPELQLPIVGTLSWTETAERTP